MLAELSALATAQGGVFNAAQARACGYSREAVERHRATGSWLAQRHGVYAPAAAVPADPAGRHQLEVAAAMLAWGRGDLVAAHASAAVLWRMSWLHRPMLTTVHLACPVPGLSHVSRTLRVAPARLDPEDRHDHPCGLAVTSPSRTVLDLARRLAFPDAVVLADSALHAGMCNASELAAALGRCRGWPGSRRAHVVVAFADGHAESAAESLARVRIAECGFPAPRLHVVLCDADGFIARVDLLLDGVIVVEIDGRVKYEGAEAGVLWKEKRREDRLREAGYEVVRLIWADLVDPARVRRKIEAAYRRAGLRSAS